jgi:N-acetylglucosamine-6-phosphate deacetylase
MDNDAMKKEKSILEGIHYETGKVIHLGIMNGIIFSLADIEDQSRITRGEKEKLPVIAPGLVDLQVNGFMGVDFNDGSLTSDQVEKASLELIRRGVTTYLPTLITGPTERTSIILKVLAESVGRRGLASSVIGGIHLEGPFISPEEGPRGAHPKQHCINPDIDLVEQWQGDSGGMIRVITLAPELPGSDELIKACVEMDMVVAIGHTSAGPEDIKNAVEAGATLSTHLGNGSHGILPRHPNYIWDQLAEDRLYASLIADGFHLPDTVIKVFMRSKEGRSILVSDSMPYAGLAPGLYDSPAAGKVRLTAQGKLHLEGNPERLAGSASTLLDGVQKIAAMEGFPTGWNMGSVRPSELLNHTSSHGLQVGARADVLLLHNSLENVRFNSIYKSGKEIQF